MHLINLPPGWIAVHYSVDDEMYTKADDNTPHRELLLSVFFTVFDLFAFQMSDEYNDESRQVFLTADADGCLLKLSKGVENCRFFGPSEPFNSAARERLRGELFGAYLRKHAAAPVEK